MWTAYLKRIEQLGAADRRELDGHAVVGDGAQLGDLVGDVLERRLAVHQVVQDAAQRPHVDGLAERQAQEDLRRSGGGRQ